MRPEEIQKSEELRNHWLKRISVQSIGHFTLLAFITIVATSKKNLKTKQNTLSKWQSGLTIDITWVASNYCKFIVGYASEARALGFLCGAQQGNQKPHTSVSSFAP